MDRVSVPSVIRSLQRREQPEESILQLLPAFPGDATYGRIRQVADDPMRRNWEAWCSENVNPSDRVTSAHTYARILFRDFRNSVQHRLDIADGSEGFAIGFEIGFDRPFFYTPRGRGTTLGFVWMR